MQNETLDMNLMRCFGLEKYPSNQKKKRRYEIAHKNVANRFAVNCDLQHGVESKLQRNAVNNFHQTGFYVTNRKY